MTARRAEAVVRVDRLRWPLAELRFDRLRCTLALLAVALLGMVPAAAIAAGTSTAVIPATAGSTSPFAPGIPESSVTTTATATTPVLATTTSSAGSSTGLSGSSALFIAIGALVVIGGIGYFIWHDARKHAPVTAATSAASAAGRTGSKAPPKSRKLSAAERRRRKRGRAR